MELLLLLLFVSLLFLTYVFKEDFCADGYIELQDSTKKITKCCPNTGDFKLITYGKKKDKFSCCQNYKKSVDKKQKSSYLELPEKGGFCTSTY